MSKPTILIVEDEPLIADDIAEVLEKNGFTVVDVVDEAEEALTAIEEYQPDLALLDINIEGAIDGIDLAAKLNIPFIFLTSYYDKPTLARAAKVSPSGYLVKPFDENDLVANIEIALSKKRAQLQIKMQAPEKLFVKKDNEIISIMSDDILFAEAYDNYTNLYTSEKKFLISHTLKSVEEKLQPHGFFRVHRSNLINFHAIDSISENYVFIKGHKVQISKSYKKDLMDRLTMI